MRHAKSVHDMHGPGDYPHGEDAPEWICLDCDKTSDKPGDCGECETRLIRN